MNPLIVYRLSHYLHRRGWRRVARVLYRLNFWLTGCQIPPQVKMGHDCRMPDYGAGVIFNGNVTLGDRVTVLPHVVLGQNVRRLGDVVPAEIIIGDDVVIGTGAKIIASGQLLVGARSVIGANAVVLRSVPPDSMAIGVPARVKALGGKVGLVGDNRL